MITKDQLTYIGAVRTPEGMFHYSGQPASIDFSRREYVMTHWNMAARLGMVRPSLPRTQYWVTDLELLDRSTVPVAPAVSELVDPSNNTWHELNRDDSGGSGYGKQEICVIGNVALVSGSIYYDAGGTQDVSWFACEWPLPLMGPVRRTPWRSIANIGEGWAAGPMTIIPERFRDMLKGDILFGQPGAMPIITRQSFGPAAISAKASDFLTMQDVPANLLLGYGQGDLAMWGEGANDIWNAATTYNSLTFVGDYLLYIGCHGYGEAKYGKGTGDQSLDGVFDPVDGGTWVYDPVAFGKGTHAFPYRMQALGFKVTDLADVAAGRKTHNEIRPAFWFPLEIPTFDHQHYGGAPFGVHPVLDTAGADYDSEKNELHVIVKGQDSHGYEPGPLDHVFKISGIPTTPNAALHLEFDGTVVDPPVDPDPDPDPDPPVDPDPDPDPTNEEIESLRQQVAAMTLTLEAERRTHQATKDALGVLTSKQSSVHAEAATILQRNATLKVNSRLPKWCTDAVTRIKTTSTP
jgi:hypothetical protein